MEQADATQTGPSRASEQPPARREPTEAIDRRSLLRLGLLGLAGSASLSARSVGAIAGGFAAAPDARPLIVRSRRPLNLETPVPALDPRLTPNSEFFVRSHFGAPAVNLVPWELELVGLVDRPMRLTLEALGRFEQATRAAVLQCAGNGRGLYRPRVPGVPWERGAVGHAEWSGVRLADLLDRAGLGDGAAHLHFLGGDSPPSPKTPAFVRSIPLDRARDTSTILALRMNGEPLPVLHGGPVRLVVPGWAGNNWSKWVRRIVVSRDEAPGFYMQTGYRMPRSPVPPGSAPSSVPMDPVTWMNVKSLITAPDRGAILPAGRVEVRGVAWTGRGHVTRVDVRIGPGDSWEAATLLDDAVPGAWRRWRLSWQPAGPGRFVIAARATDSMDQVQPEQPAWNKSGYLWNGFDTVECEVR